MNARRAPYAFLALVCAAGILHVVHYLDRLPEQVATHFASDGTPDGWTERQDFLGLTVVLIVGPSLLLAGLGAVVGRIPDAYINLPAKDYWLAPERRERTMAVLSTSLAWFACSTASFVILLDHFVIEANLRGRNLSSSAGALAIGFALYVVIWSVRLIVRFRRPAS